MDEVQDLLVKLIANMLLLATPVVVGYVAVWFKNWAAKTNERIELQIGEQQYSLLEKLAGNLVRAAEQTFDLDKPGHKKMYVMAMLSSLAHRYNIDIDRQQIEAFLEAAVKAMNDEQLPTWEAPTFEIELPAVEITEG